MKTIAHEFYDEAIKYCDLIDSFEKYNTPKKYMTLLEGILCIYSKGLELKKINIDDFESLDAGILYPKIKIDKYNYYWEVFNSYHFEEPIQSSLTDDVSDIYYDLQEGMLLYRQNKIKDAIGTWKFNFEIHWGFHAVGAIRALHSLVFRNIDED